MIGDGDSKIHSILAADPYSGTPVERFECIGHIQKRIGSRLQSKHKQELSDGKGTSGCVRLTERMINNL